ncbi:MAG: hypothetical protein HC932_02180 [Thermales bacterium]|nr:hypothetical protein [Thermales bacterium]
MKASEFLQNLKQLQEEDLVGIKGVGQVLALNYTEFLSSPRFLKILKGFEQLEKKPSRSNDSRENYYQYI